MFGNSTDLVIRRFMVRITKLVFVISCLVAIGVGCLPFVPKFPQSWGAFLGQFHHFFVGVPLGLVFLLLTMEVGKMFSKERWCPQTCWVVFIAALSSVPLAVVGHFFAQHIAEQGEMSQYATGLRIVSIGLIVCFLIKFGSIVARQRLFEKAYLVLFVLVVAYLLYNGWQGLLVMKGNPFDNLPEG